MLHHFLYTNISCLFFFFDPLRVLNEFIMKNPSLENKKDQRDLQVSHSELSAVAKTLFLSALKSKMGRSDKIICEVSCVCLCTHRDMMGSPCFFRM
jgi:hypothetical protein